MIVCVCRRISDHQIRAAAAEGAMSLECLKTELGVATQCGHRARLVVIALIFLRNESQPNRNCPKRNVQGCICR